MPNPNPYRARQAKKHLAEVMAGDLMEARKAVWQAVLKLDDAIRSEFTDVSEAADMGDAERRVALLCRCSHALAQASAAYERLTESTEHEARLRELEDAHGIVSPWATKPPTA